MSHQEAHSPTQFANSFFIVVLAALFLFSLALAPWHDTWTLAFLVGLPSVAIPTLLIYRAPDSLLARATVGAATMIFCGLNIQQAHGMTELHFGIFAMLALLLCYEDWRVIVVAAAVIAVHHLLFSYLQQTGHAMICMPQPGMGLVLVHAAYVVIEAAGLSYLAVLMRRKTVSSAGQNASERQRASFLEGVVTQIHSGIDQTSQASEVLARLSDEIELGARKQASCLEQTTTGVEKIGSIMRRSAESAKAANQLAASSGESAARGGRVVSDVETAMVEIKASSSKIAEIISTINEIAFQTNLLAVNAAVEAARAGENGRGFAVVAFEVRSLAQRTSAAAKEIKGLVEDSLKKVQRGGELATHSGETLHGIVNSVGELSHMVAGIARASEEQKMAIEVVNSAITQVDGVTQANSTQTRQLASTAQSLAAQSKSLMDLLGTLSANKPTTSSLQL